MRPTKFNESMCDQVIEWGKLGKSRTWMAATLGISRSTLNLWKKENKLFSDALDCADAFSQLWWEDAGQNGLTADKFNASIWSRSMAARFPHEWREKVAHVGGDEDDNPIEQRVTLDADAFTRGIAGLASKLGADSQTE